MQGHIAISAAPFLHEQSHSTAPIQLSPISTPDLPISDHWVHRAAPASRLVSFAAAAMERIADQEQRQVTMAHTAEKIRAARGMRFRAAMGLLAATATAAL